MYHVLSFWPTKSCHAPQYMEGGDLHKALARDVRENGAGASRRLSWYGRGHRVLLDVASGLTYLHSEQVRMGRTQGVQHRTLIVCCVCCIIMLRTA